MVINRLKDYFGPEPEERPPDQEYYIVGGVAGYFYVTRETARSIARQLERRRPPRWIVFRDLTGSEVRVRPCKLDAVYESTAEQRARERAFIRARKMEAEGDQRPWEEDE
ncbi:MAG: hypothetical protein PVI01_11870 [Gemmatimonadales bacterium]|jgi:hypothetical protein